MEFGDGVLSSKLQSSKYFVGGDKSMDLCFARSFEIAIFYMKLWDLKTLLLKHISIENKLIHPFVK